MDSPFNVLGVDPGADEEVVRAAYRTLMKKHHPDQGGSAEEFMQIKDAYETIQNGTVSGANAGNGSGRRSTDGGTATRNGSGQAAGEVTVTEYANAAAVNCCSGVGLEIRGEYLTLTLIGLVDDADVTRLVSSHTLSGYDERPVAYFTVENTSDRTVRWRGNQCLSFIGSDEYMYESDSEYRASETKLPPRWKSSDVAIEPGTRMNAIVIAEELPEDVGVNEVVYTQNVFARRRAGSGIQDKERYRFRVTDSAKHMLAKTPF
jgi:hypothetical protein